MHPHHYTILSPHRVALRLYFSGHYQWQGHVAPNTLHHARPAFRALDRNHIQLSVGPLPRPRRQNRLRCPAR